MRSDCVLPKIKEKVINLLFNTKLSYTKIGKILDCSRGPVCKIYKECKKNGITRNNIKKTGKMLICKWCSELFYKSPGHMTRGRSKFCSKQCYTLWQKSEDNIGQNNPNWVDGGRHEDYLNHLRKSDEWTKWREQVFQRDNYTCQLCAEKGKELHPHHIKQKCDFPDLIFDVDNGITLCKECHRSKGVHSYKSNIYKLFVTIVLKNNEAQLFHR